VKQWLRTVLMAACVFGFATSASTPAYGVDWPQFHFSASQRGTNPYETVAKARKCPSRNPRYTNGSITSMASIANGQVDIGTDPGRLVSFALR
jgi:hypothetical protein